MRVSNDHLRVRNDFVRTRIDHMTFILCQAGIRLPGAPTPAILFLARRHTDALALRGPAYCFSKNIYGIYMTLS